MPTWDESGVLAAAKRLRLALDPRRRRHGIGQRLGAGPGASLEFHDHRAYVLGDDLRHLDWGVFARTDQLVLRRHRVEVSPVVEILLDISLSVDAHRERFAALTGLAALFATVAEQDGGRPRVWVLGEKPRRLQAWREELRAVRSEGSTGPDVSIAALAPGADRIVLTDGMCAAGGRTVIERLGRGAGRISAIHLLTTAEREPVALGPVHVRDAEFGQRDLVLDDAAIADYRLRLQRHQAGWREALHGRGCGLCLLALEDGFAAQQRELIQIGLLEVRA